MYKWYLPTLSEIIALADFQPERNDRSLGQQRVRAEREWSGAVAALNQLLQQQSVEHSFPDVKSVHGVVLSGPSPVLSQCDSCDRMSAWTFTVGSVGGDVMPLQLPAADHPDDADYSEIPTLPLLPDDPLASEQFCLVLTPHFSLVMALGDTDDTESAFQFSFEPAVVRHAWQALRSRLLLTRSLATSHLDTLVKQFEPMEPHYQTVMQFSRLLLAHMPEPCEWDLRRPSASSTRESVITVTSDPSADSTDREPIASVAAWQPAIANMKNLKKVQRQGSNGQQSSDRRDFAHVKSGSDTELLQAIAHEVRTPLTTIRTLTRLLLKRKDLNPDVLKRLEVIDHECTEQINRFNLFFRAVELETSAVKSPLSPLAAISLAQVFQQNVPRWQQQASQRNLELDVILPQKLPMVVADPTMLDQVLTGLIDRITHSLPPGSRIQVHVSLAGHQLKLQFQSQPPLSEGMTKTDSKSGFTPTLKSLGQLLMFQPETGNLSLNLSVTKNLFQALGGKLIVRQKPQQGEVLTIFLPLETRTLEP